MKRKTFEVSKQKTTRDTSYYVSNSVLEPSTAKPLAGELAQAIRRHWGVESNNWIRDATFNEDGIKTKAGNQAQVMGLLRGLAIELIRKTMPKNFQAAIEKFADVPGALESMLLQVNFLLESRGLSLSFGIEPVRLFHARHPLVGWRCYRFGKGRPFGCHFYL